MYSKTPDKSDIIYFQTIYKYDVINETGYRGPKINNDDDSIIDADYDRIRNLPREPIIDKIMDISLTLPNSFKNTPKKHNGLL